jgi:hypothetical protein
VKAFAMTARYLVLAGSLLLATPAGAADTTVTIASDPPGALVYWLSEGGVDQAFGYAPVTVPVHLPRGKGSCYDTPPLRVRWVSGAEAALPTLHVCEKTPGKAPIVFIRPTGIAGLEADARFGLDLAREAEATQDRKIAARQAKWAAALSAMPPPAPVAPPVLVPYVTPPLPASAYPSREVRCTSTIMGTYVYTTCR